MDLNTYSGDIIPEIDDFIKGTNKLINSLDYVKMRPKRKAKAKRPFKCPKCRKLHLKGIPCRINKSNSWNNKASKKELLKQVDATEQYIRDRGNRRVTAFKTRQKG